MRIVDLDFLGFYLGIRKAALRSRGAGERAREADVLADCELVSTVSWSGELLGRDLMGCD